jgi:hypothetical protein
MVRSTAHSGHSSIQCLLRCGGRKYRTFLAQSLMTQSGHRSGAISASTWLAALLTPAFCRSEMSLPGRRFTASSNALLT